MPPQDDAGAASPTPNKPDIASRGASEWGKGFRWFFTFGLPMYSIVAALLFMACTSIWGVGQRGAVSQGAQSNAAAVQAKGVAPAQTRTPGLVPPAIPMPESSGAVDAPVATSGESGKGENAAGTVPGAVVGTITPSEVATVSTVAKMALDTTKERVDGMKDTYDRLFAMIAALGALLAFLGFKGFESFTLAKKNAAEVVEKAELAVAKANAANQQAERAKEQADEAVKKLNFFVDVEYPRNNLAEIEVARGIIMREIAGVYQAVAKRCGQEIKDYPEYRKAIDLGLSYLRRAVSAPERMDPETVSRALITIGNLSRRMNNIHGAVEACQRVVNEFSPNEAIAHYNLACYYCLLAEQEEKAGGAPQQVQSYAAAGISSLERAIELDGSNRADARNDDDFAWFQQHPAFKALVAVGAAVTTKDVAAETKDLPA